MAVLAISAFALSGCQEAGGSSGDQKASGGTTKVVYIPKNLGNPYFDSIDAGFKEAAKALGFEYELTGPASTEPTSQIPFINAAIQKKVSAIAVSPNDDEALLPSLKRAKDAGIKVITVNSDMKATDGRDVAIMPTDFSPMGKFLLDLQGETMNYEGDFAVLSATSTAPDQNSWIDGMKKALASDSKYARMKLVDTVYGDDLPNKSTTEARALLTKHPNLKGIVAPTAVGLPATAKVVSESTQKGKIAVTGLALPNSMKEYVGNGTVKKFGLWDPKREGVIAGYLLVGMVKGDIKPTGGTSFTAGSLGTFTIQPNGQIISGPLVSFDASNISQYNF